jgi:hypothetical protein
MNYYADGVVHKKNRLIIKPLTFLVILCILIYGCKTVAYKPAIAVVTNTQHRHWGYGYYKLEVYYMFFNGTDSITGHWTASGKEEINTAKYIKGDSLIIGYNPNDITDTYISKKIYAKPRFRK